MDDLTLGLAQTGLREAMLLCETAREDLAASERAAIRTANSALGFTLDAAERLAVALGYNELQRAIKTLREV